MSIQETKQQVATALAAAKDKKAEDIALLELPKESSAFTDYFLICSGTNPRQVQAIADAIDEALSRQGIEPNNREGYENAEWVLLDYVNFVIHIFSGESRRFYDLERLWKSATHLSESDLLKPAKKAVAKKAALPAVKKAPAKKAKVPAKKVAVKKSVKKATKKAVKKRK